MRQFAIIQFFNIAKHLKSTILLAIRGAIDLHPLLEIAYIDLYPFSCVHLKMECLTFF